LHKWSKIGQVDLKVQEKLKNNRNFFCLKTETSGYNFLPMKKVVAGRLITGF